MSLLLWFFVYTFLFSSLWFLHNRRVKSRNKIQKIKNKKRNTDVKIKTCENTRKLGKMIRKKLVEKRKECQVRESGIGFNFKWKEKEFFIMKENRVACQRTQTRFGFRLCWCPFVSVCKSTIRSIDAWSGNRQHFATSIHNKRIVYIERNRKTAQIHTQYAHLQSQMPDRRA